MSDSEWTAFMLTWGSCTTNGGTIIKKGPAMRRRKPDKTYEYRAMTMEEMQDYLASEAW